MAIGLGVAAVLGIVLKYVFRTIRLIVKIALSRVTVVMAFCATVYSTVTGFWTALNDSSSFVSRAISSFSAASTIVGEFVAGNDFVQAVFYAVSLDVLVDGIVASFFWVFCTLASALVVATVSVFVGALPMFTDLVLSGLKHQLLDKWDVMSGG